MTFLLDVNVLIALVDPTHVSHGHVHQWFARQGSESWATCPMTENGLVRIVGNPKYRNTPGSPALVATALAGLRRLPGHIFWADDISLADPVHVDAARLLASGQITDTYLLALAVAHGGKLATMDRRIVDLAVHRRQGALFLI